MEAKYAIHKFKIKKVAEWTNESSLYCSEPFWGSGREVVIFEDGTTDFADCCLPLTWKDLHFRCLYICYVQIPKFWVKWGLWVGFILEDSFDDLEF